MSRVVAAVDIGASGGRVMAGLVEEGAVTLQEVHRFANAMVERDGHLRWDVRGLFDEVLVGLGRLAATHPHVESIGIDTWAVDYALLDAHGALLADPIAYRDGRTAAVIDDVHARVGAGDLYAVNGLQFLPFTTLYQLAAEQRGPLWPHVAHVVLLPDLFAFWLTGALRTEVTNASTMGLLDASTRTWSAPLLDRLAVPAHLLPALESPGAVRGQVLPEIRTRTGLPDGVVVTTVASHDTASAVAGVPATDPRFAYVVSGTWSLVGVESAAPVITEQARAANFTNEAGVDGRTRLLRNVGGLWLLQESLREWQAHGAALALSDLLERAAELPDGGPVVDVDDPDFIAPGDMPRRIAAAAASAAGDRRLTEPAAVTRCILDSLAHGYARTIDVAARLSGQQVDVVHLVGGGVHNELLCRLTADRTGRRVVAGPVEATALGNVSVQARALGAIPDDLDAVRRLLATGQGIRTYEPATG